MFGKVSFEKIVIKIQLAENGGEVEEEGRGEEGDRKNGKREGEGGIGKREG